MSQQLTYPQLLRRLTKRGLPLTGSRQELAERLRRADETTAAEKATRDLIAAAAELNVERVDLPPEPSIDETLHALESKHLVSRAQARELQVTAFQSTEQKAMEVLEHLAELRERYEGEDALCQLSSINLQYSIQSIR